MEILKTAKDLASLLQKMGNIDMLRQMVTLQEQVTELVEENRTLKEHLSRRQTAVFRKNSYWVGEDGPYCSQCMDTKGHLIRLHVGRGRYPKCPACNTVAFDPDDKPFVIA